MLNFISNKCTEVLIVKGIINEDRRAVYNYGFQLFWSTTGCVSCVLILGLIFNYMVSAIIFLVSFMMLRFVAGGYHAKTYQECFICTNFIAMLCVGVSKLLYLWDYYPKDIILYILFMLSVFYIWIKAPVISKKTPSTKEQIIKKRLFTRIFLGVEIIALIIMAIVLRSSEVYTVIISLCAVAVLIMLERKGGKRHG